MRIVLLGAPGSGKGTQADILRQQLGIPHISTGDLLRAAVAAGTKLGKQAKTVMESGELVPDELVLGMLRERLQQDDCRSGFIIDGYPRNLAQAQALDQLLEQLGQAVEQAVQIDVDTAAIVTRLAQRAEQEGRSDDTAETVRKRLDVYREQTAAVIGFYRQRHILVEIPGGGTINEVSQRILGKLRPASTH